MLKRRLCQAEFTWDIVCQGPLLIADGRYRDIIKRPRYKDTWTKPNGFPDALFISRLSESEIIQAQDQIRGGSPKLSFYLPGTSLRGPFRGQAERIIRSLRGADDLPPQTACDPFEEKAEKTCQEGQPPRKLLQNCAKREQEFSKTPQGRNDHQAPYARACPACKIFGFAGLASRISFKDADLDNGYRSVYRDMVGIDRFTGGQSSGALMRFHVLENVAFTATVTLANFELCHLGLLAYVFRDFEDGLVPIGFGKTKGFGLVEGKVTKITLSYPRSLPPQQLHHLGSLLSPTELESYGINAPDSIPLESLTPRPDPSGLGFFNRQELSGKADIDAFWAAVAPVFNDYLTRLGQSAAPAPAPAADAPEEATP